MRQEEKSLLVYMHTLKAGRLVQDMTGHLSFTYDQSYLQHPGAIPLSFSLPLQVATFSNSQCRGYFSGLLPESEVREVVAKNLGISAKSDFSMLREIGGECAGALSFIVPGQEETAHAQDNKHLAESHFADILRSLPQRPLLAGEKDIRLSLAGAQEKLAIIYDDDGIALPLGSAISTHIVKPDLVRFPDIIYNEDLCMQLARRIGLKTADTQIKHADTTPYLLIKRYDRIQTGQTGKPTERIHQEDFCQALGIISDRKYQREGGPSLANCFKLIRDTTVVPATDIIQMLNAVLFNFLIGNNDAHGKNFSFLYVMHADGSFSMRLAPFYDLIATSYYPELSPLMAMEIGDKYKSAEVRLAHFEKMGQACGFSNAMLFRQLHIMIERIINAISEIDLSHPKRAVVAEFISERVNGMSVIFK
jgi:serine/threonine-protein kinase HipA